MAIKTFTDIVEAMKSFIRSRQPKIDLGEGTPANDLMISAPAQEMSQIYEELDLTSKAQSIDTADDAALEKLAANVGLLRKSARKSIGSVTFFSTTPPASDIVIASGTSVSTVSSNNSTSIQFVTTRTTTMFAAMAAGYLNPVTSRYELSVDVEATSGGLDSNVGSNTITTLVTPISGISGVYNPYSTTGGSDTESLDSLRSRMAAKWAGAAIGTEDGYLSLILAQSGVEDAVVVGHGGITRTDPGAVDVFIKGNVPRYYEETFAPASSVTLYKQPVLSSGIVQVMTALSGSIVSSRYSLVKDAGAYGGSYVGLDQLVFSPALAAAEGTILVAYNYNGLVEDLQTLFRMTNNDVLNVDLLVRWATELTIDITARIRVTSGYDADEVKALMSNLVSQFFASQAIGQQLQQADVARVMLNTPGVDDVVLPFDVFRSTDSSVTVNSENNLDIPTYAYAAAGTFTFNVIV